MFYWAAMDWKSAVESKRGPLLVEVLKLFAMIGLSEGVAIERISRPLHRQVLAILRTAESAVRRLIIAAARDIVVEPRPPRPARERPKTSREDKATADGEARAESKQKRKRHPLFCLFDAPRRIKKFFGRKRRRLEPRIRFFPAPEPDTRHPIFRGLRQPEPPPPPPPPPPQLPVVEKKVDDGMVSAKTLVRRLLAVLDAVQDIPRHARRYALWQARPYEERHPQRRSALRPGRPPGFRQRAKYEIDEILKDCHWLARNVMPQLDDTS